jgi:hypothetical protein
MHKNTVMVDSPHVKKCTFFSRLNKYDYVSLRVPLCTCVWEVLDLSLSLGSDILTDVFDGFP